MAFTSHSPEAPRLKKEAQKMYNDGFQQKEIAASINVSEKKIGIWAKNGKWKSKRSLKVDVGLSPLLAKFIQFVMDKKPSLIKELEALQTEFKAQGEAK